MQVDNNILYWLRALGIGFVIVLSQLTLVQSIAPTPSLEQPQQAAVLISATVAHETLVGELSTGIDRPFAAQEVRTTRAVYLVREVSSCPYPLSQRTRQTTTVFASMCLWQFLIPRKVGAPPEDPSSSFFLS